MNKAHSGRARGSGNAASRRRGYDQGRRRRTVFRSLCAAGQELQGRHRRLYGGERRQGRRDDIEILYRDVPQADPAQSKALAQELVVKGRRAISRRASISRPTRWPSRRC